VLALSRPTPKGLALVVMSASDGERLPGPPPEIARGDLVSVVAYGAMTTKLIAEADAAAAAAGIPVLAAFAGPRSYSVVVDAARSVELTQLWHARLT
jgi:hypothetical protein